MKTAQKILDFWFSDKVKAKWFDKDPAFDEEIRQQFLEIYESETMINWEETPENMLAHIILLDQFPRNMFRDTPRAFATDEIARQLANDAIEKGFDQKLPREKRHFLYMPFMHSENKAEQQRSVELFNKLGRAQEFAQRHKEIIDRFGRFPHRNAILGRESTREEQEFLKQPNSGF